MLHVTDFLGDSQGLPDETSALLVMTVPTHDVTEVHQCHGFAEAVTGPPECAQPLLKEADRLLVAAQFGVDGTEVIKCAGFPRVVAGLPKQLPGL